MARRKVNLSRPTLRYRYGWRACEEWVFG